MWAYLARSTLKREFATALTAWLIVMATRQILTAVTWDQSHLVLDEFLPYIMATAAAAFGADFVAKQTNIAGPPQKDDDGPPRDGGDHRDGDHPPDGNQNP